MFRRNGLPTRLLTAVLAIAMAWATTPTQGLAEALTTLQTQTTTSASSDASSDTSTSNSTPTGEKDQEATPSKSSTTDSDSSSSNDGEKASATDEKDSESNDKSDAVAALAAPAAPSQSASDSKDGQSTFTAHWTNAPDNEISYTNDDFNKDDQNTWTDFSCTPSENSLHKSTLKVYLKLAGDSKTTYKIGSVKIYVPAGFYRRLDKSDPLLVACNDSAWGMNRPLSQVSWMIPKAPETNSVTDFNYVEKTQEVDGNQVDYYVMQNAKELTGSTELDVDIDYRFRPTMLDVRSQPQADGSDIGIYDNSCPVTCDVNGKQVGSRRNIGVTVKTKVDSSSVTLTRATQDDNKGVFFKWDSVWGKKPADADKYFYVIWYATYQRGANTTMPFNYRLSINQSKADGGELIGVQKYTGDTHNDNGFAPHKTVLDLMDNSYSGICGHLDLLDKEWVGVLNNPTKSFAIGAGMCGQMGFDYGANSIRHFQVYALLFRYPLSKVSDAIKNGVDMASQGIKVDTGVTLTETWKDGHEVTNDYSPSGDTTVKALPAGGGARELTKVRENEEWRIKVLEAVQSFLSQGKDVELPDFTLRSYNFDDKVVWDNEKETYRASTGFDIKDGDYYLYSATPDYFGKAPGIDSISSNNPLKLDENEFSLKSFYLDDDEYDVAYTEGLGWQRAARTSDDYTTYEPISIYIRKCGEKGLIKYGEIVRNANGYAFKSVDGTQDVNGVSGNNRVKLPDSVVQIEMKQGESNHYASYVRLHYNVVLHPDKRMEDRLNNDIESNKSSVVGGFASGEQTVEGKSLGYANNELGQYWHCVSYHLSPVRSDVVLQKETYGLSDDANSGERAIPVSVDYWTQTNVYENSEVGKFANSEYMKPYMVSSGVFYDLLPAGTYVKRDEIAIGVRTGPMSWHGMLSGIEPIYDKQVELLPDWNNSGRTMLKVTFNVPDGKGQYINYWSGLRLNYTLHDTYANIVDRGGRVTNSAVLINTSDNDVIFNSNAQGSSYKGKGFDDWKYFKDIAQSAWKNGYEAATTQTVMDFGNVTALQAGFSSRVSTDINPAYQESGAAYLGDRYIDRLQYTSSSSTRTDDLILYDVFSPEDKNAVGRFESIDVSSIESKPTYDPNDPKTTDTCKPVVYYATQVPTDKTRSLDSRIWSNTPPKNLSTVRAVAIDCRKTDAGNDFVLDRKGTLAAYIGLKATGDESYTGRTEKNEALISVRTFVGTEPASSDKPTTMTANRTVKLLAANLSIEKTCDPESGIESKPAEIGNAANKKLTYTITVTNKAEDKTLPDVTRIHVKDVLPKGLVLESPSDMTVQSESLSIKNTKIGGQSIVSYQIGNDGVSFDIAKLPSGGSISITVPVVRKDPVKETTEYVNTATIEMIGNEKDGQSSSTYHKTSVSTMPLAGAGGFAGLVVAGSVVLGASAVAWVRRRRRE